jgi:hypothetical protein
VKTARRTAPRWPIGARHRIVGYARVAEAAAISAL